MPAEILTDCKVVVASYDFGNLARRVTIAGDAQMVEVTGFGDTSRRFVKSIRSWTADVDYFDDFTDNALNENIDTWWRATASQAVAIRKADATVTAINPEWRGSAFVVTANLLNASFGEASGGTLRLQGDGDITRNVT